MRRLIGVVALGLLVAGCTAPATPYQPFIAYGAHGVHGGYSETKLAPDRYLVRFHGNSMTSRDRVEGYLLFRAAELTLKNGDDWFLVVDRNTEHNVRTVVEPDPFYRPYWRPNWSYYSPELGWRSWSGWSGNPFWADQYDVRRIEAFEASAEVLTHKGPVPDGEPGAIEARRVISELTPTIERPKP